MTTWTLSYQIHGDVNNSGGRAIFRNTLNGNVLPAAQSKLDSNHPIPWGEDKWANFSCDVTGIFNPDTDNSLYCGYDGGGDYGNIRRLRIQSDDGRTYYGEYPKGFPYTSEQYSSGLYGPDDGGTIYERQAGDGDFPPQQWNQQITEMISNPLDPNGNPSSDRCWFYFTIPTALDGGWTVGYIGTAETRGLEYVYTGQDQTFTVPVGVTLLTVDVSAAAGGLAGFHPDVSGGSGGRWIGTIIVSPGDVLTLRIGGQPSADTTAGGWPDGGDSYSSTNGSEGGPGGGSTSIWRGSELLLIVGAGGGAGGGESTELFGRGGNGGSATGEDGQAGNTTGTTGGKGATQAAGGAAGASPSSADTLPTAGTVAKGGTGGRNNGWYNGGGGGGGYRCGGGGGAAADAEGANLGSAEGYERTCGSGGGGGSTFAAAAATETSNIRGDNVGMGSLILSW